MIDILVPVLARPWNAQPVVDSIIENTSSPHRIIFICSLGDEKQIKASRKTGHETWLSSASEHGNYAKKINWGFEETFSEWVFQGADDIRFGPKWDVHALAVGARNFSVIGTNDLGNPSVLRGRNSTHSLFHRSYIEEYGGTVDGSGAVLSELYDHQCVDNEFIHTAIQRKKFAFAKNSVVEHLHPLWGKAEMDATYEKALQNGSSDMLLFKERLLLIKDQTRLERRARRVA